MPTNFYDVIAIGDDLAGLIGATLCARRGLRVLVAESGAPSASRYHLGPYVLPRTVMPFVGETSPAVRRVITELNFIQTLKRRLTPLKPAFQVVLPDARLEVHADPELLGRELDRELPAERAAIDKACARAAEISKVLEPVLGQDLSFPPDGFWERRELARSDSRLPAADEDLLAEIPAGNAARAFFQLPAAFSLPTDPRALTPASIARAFDLWRRGCARLEGGPEALRSMLLEKLRTQHAGEVRVCEAASVVTKWGRVAGVTLRERDETLGCRHILGGTPIAEIGDLFADKRPKRVLQLERAIRPTAYRFVLNVVLGSAGLPEGLSPVTFVVIDPAKPLIGDNAFAILVGEPDQEARVVVTVLANAPAPGDNQTLDDILAALRPRILARLEQVMPFSSEHILLVHSPNQPREAAGQPREAANDRFRMPVILPEPLWSSTLPPALGVGGLPYDIGVKGITVASAQNLCGLGLEGSFAAGWCAARIISTAEGKKKDYLKDEVLLGS